MLSADQIAGAILIALVFAIFVFVPDVWSLFAEEEDDADPGD